MGILATDSRQLIYIYSDDSRLGKKILGYVQGTDKTLRVININEEAISQTIWAEIATMLGVELETIFSTNHPFSPLDKKAKTYCDEDWLKLIENNPGLLKRPIIINGNEAKQISESSDIYSFYNGIGSDFDKSPEAIKNANHINSTKKTSK